MSAIPEKPFPGGAEPATFPPASPDRASSLPASSDRAGFDLAGRKLLAYLRRLPMSEPARLEMALDVLRETAGQPQAGQRDETGQTATPQRPDLMAATAMDLLLHRIHAPHAAPDAEPTPSVKRTPMAPEFPRLKSRIKRAPPAGSAPSGAETTPTLPGRTLERFRPLEPERRPLEREHQAWARTVHARRLLLLALIALPTVVADARMAALLPHKGSTILEIVLLMVFAILFAWISIGFWTAMAGFVLLLRRSDRFAITTARPTDRPERQGVRTAVVYPVFGEDMDRVAAGIEAVHNSLQRVGGLPDFDFFILSDTRDPEAWAEEESAWAALRDRLGGTGRVFYRRRRVNTKKKSGNIADFCRRFGACYTYMLVMDADSVMSGRTITRMVSVMERNRRVGMLQSVPGVVGRDTPLARVQQFSSRLYGPMFAAGFHFWLLGDAQFWGHNALIRLRPFMRHCALPRLPGKPPLGGDIVSHDFVESTLMRRAGWSVWMAYDLDGSYEETPSNLLDELARDRRWCMGNMQHLRLVFSSGLFPVHRFLFLNGVMAYGSALLWFLFLAVSTTEAIIEALVPAVYFPPNKTLFPSWPVWEPWWALSLLLTTGVLLFLPKLFSLLLVLLRGRARLFGGLPRLAASILLEVVISSLLAPIRMQFHAKFVFATLLGRVTEWDTQTREDRPTPWSEAIRFHLGGALLAALWAMALYFLNERFFWWVSPIFVPLVLSVPLSVAGSMPATGRWLRRAGLLLIPEEVDPPPELVELKALHQRNLQAPRPLGIPKGQGVALAVVDPGACGLRLGLIRLRVPARRTGTGAQTLQARGMAHAAGEADGANRGDKAGMVDKEDMVDKAAGLGPAGLTQGEKSALLTDPEALAGLHRAVWLLPDEHMRRAWFADIP